MESQNTAQKIKSELKRACHEAVHSWHYPTLASVFENQPQQRTLVLRRFHSENWAFDFFTDYRSAKVGEFKEQAQAALHFYDPHKQWQLRLSGHIDIHHNNERSKESLAQIPAHKRRDYQSLLAPGEVIESPGIYRKELAEANFTLLCFKASKLDFLELKTGEHLRVQADLSTDQWRRVQA